MLRKTDLAELLQLLKENLHEDEWEPHRITISKLKRFGSSVKVCISRQLWHLLKKAGVPDYKQFEETMDRSSSWLGIRYNTIRAASIELFVGIIG
jgi:hypothetical protein